MALSKDIVLNDEALEKAVLDFKSIAEDIEALRKSIEIGLEHIRTGYRSTAGKKYADTCELRIADALYDQKKLIEKISDNLTDAKNEYQSVFNAYIAMNNKLN